ncbi:MAG: ribosome recycling factor [Chloroflexi bacterium]|nr:ribosome recycling factor [Chloroflexota bacterium]
MIEESLNKAKSRMQQSIAAFERNLTGFRTGRANPGLIEHLMVDYYGTQTPLKQLAAISVAGGTSLVLQIWDKGAASSVEKAILKSDLGLTPVTEGTTIRLPIPALTEERRRDLVKMVRKRLEESKVAMRNIRRDSLDELRSMEKAKEISQDDQRRAQDKLQKTTDGFVSQAGQLGAQKEAELMEV